MSRNNKNPKTNNSKLDKAERKQRQQQRKIDEYQKRERWMRWGAMGVLALVLLLFLMAGYATDWMRGLKKEPVATPISTGLDSATQEEATSTGQDGNPTNTATTSNRSSTGANNTRETSNNNSTTRETTTTNNNTTTPAPNPPSTPPPAILDLFADVNVGDALDDILTLGDSLDLEVKCEIDLLIRICDFSEDGLTVSTRSLLGTGLITSVTKNF